MDLLGLLPAATAGLVIVMMATGVIWFKPAVDYQREELEEANRLIREALQRACADMSELQRSFPQAGIPTLDLLEHDSLRVQAKRAKTETVKLRTYGEPGHGRTHYVPPNGVPLVSSRKKKGDFGFVPATAVDGNEPVSIEPAKIVPPENLVARAAERSVVEEIHELGKKEPVAAVMSDGEILDYVHLKTGAKKLKATPAEVKVAARKVDREYCLEQLLARGTERSLAEWTVDESGLDLAVMAANFRNPPALERAPAPIRSWAAGGS